MVTPQTRRIRALLIGFSLIDGLHSQPLGRDAPRECAANDRSRLFFSPCIDRGPLADQEPIKNAQFLLENFFREAGGQARNRLDVGLIINDLGIHPNEAEPALHYLTQRGLVTLPEEGWAYLTPLGVRVSIGEVTLRQLEAKSPSESLPHLLQITSENQFLRPLSPKMLVGRSPECDIMVDDQRASKHHAIISHDGTNYILEDLESANGTLINGSLCVEPTCLEHDDEIVIGRTMLVFQTPHKQTLVPSRAASKHHTKDVNRHESTDMGVDTPDPTLATTIEDVQAALHNSDTSIQEVTHNPTTHRYEEPELPQMVLSRNESFADLRATLEHTLVASADFDTRETLTMNSIVEDTSLIEDTSDMVIIDEATADLPLTEVPYVEPNVSDAANMSTPLPIDAENPSLTHPEPDPAVWIPRLLADLDRLKVLTKQQLGDHSSEHAVFLAINVILSNPLIQELTKQSEH